MEQKDNEIESEKIPKTTNSNDKSEKNFEQKDTSQKNQARFDNENKIFFQKKIPAEEQLDEDFEFFYDEPDLSKELEIIGEEIEQIKCQKENDLDDYLKGYIEDLEEFSSILNLEDLIVDPTYTFNLLMKCLKKVFNFKYFYTKFSISKEKREVGNEKIDKKKRK